MIFVEQISTVDNHTFTYDFKLIILKNEVIC